MIRKTEHQPHVVTCQKSRYRGQEALMFLIASIPDPDKCRQSDRHQDRHVLRGWLGWPGQGRPNVEQNSSGEICRYHKAWKFAVITLLNWNTTLFQRSKTLWIQSFSSLARDRKWSTELLYPLTADSQHVSWLANSVEPQRILNWRIV